MKLTGAKAPHERTNLTPKEQKQARKRSFALLRQMLRPYMGALAASVVSVLVAAVAAAAQPVLIARVLDTAIAPITHGDTGPLLTLLAVFAVSVLVNAGATWANVAYTVRVSLGVLLHLRTRVFKHSQALSVSFHESYTSGRVISRLTNDVETIATFLGSGLSQLVTTLLNMLFSVVAIFVLDWRIGVLLLLTGVPIYLLTRWFQRGISRIFRSLRNESAQLTTRFVETFTGIRAVKGFGAEAAARAEYAAVAERYRVAVMDSIKMFGIYSPTLMLFGNVFVAAALVIGGYAVLGGTMQVGTLLALIIYANRVFEPIMTLSEFYNLFQSAFSALEKISGFLAEKPQIQDPQHPVSLPQSPAALVDAESSAEATPLGEIVLEDAAFGYTAGQHALMPTSLRIAPGQTVALVGETGAGKSTIAKLIARFYDVDTGRVLLDGVDVRSLTDRELRRNVVMLTQEVFLFSASIAENIRLGNPQATDDQVHRAAQAVGADEFIQTLPQGYGTMLGRGGVNLSTGQRQLVSFARVFLANPRVLILDEATASLDIPSERAVQRALNALLAGRTAVVIAHRLSTVLSADRVLVVSAGSIVEDGSPQELIAAGGEFAAMYTSWEDARQDSDSPSA
ncbi:ABC transporter [Rothia sp. HMSC064D08]|uniref:ABC transporter ATP-binding protein n=1 Tax=Rothia sp. HMSC064D08 TaxID=1715104 RepID=UPI0008A3C2E9|nr:ABC transporter ATP-binding protein [Rothia sp. HMSC064D08]OFN03184.1 ABC transporter [Rothia sp. HMSC064D08]